MLWAKEEQTYGNNIFYWHIMKSEETKVIASNVPTTKEELVTLGVLGENKINQYGDKLLRGINRFIESNGLEGYLKKAKPGSKRPLSDGGGGSAAATGASPANQPTKRRAIERPGANKLSDAFSDDEEFATDIDFGALGDGF
uniref:HRDC domain-containing protein n=1 Tax=Craspedostauros australis TaxID=1486917 RepID=A0A7R9ZIQ7_9STRA